MLPKLLSADGVVRELSADELQASEHLDATDPAAALLAMGELNSTLPVTVTLSSSADGRSFSLLSQLRLKCPEHTQVWVAGNLLPDQITLAFQCGATAAVIDADNWARRGEVGWRHALSPNTKLGYRAQVWSEVSSIAALRKAG